MTKDEIIEGNKLIAEFMEIPKCGRCSDCGAYQYSPAVIWYPSEMRYLESWDWLMPVIKKMDIPKGLFLDTYKLYFHVTNVNIEASWQSIILILKNNENI